MMAIDTQAKGDTLLRGEPCVVGQVIKHNPVHDCSFRKVIARRKAS